MPLRGRFNRDLPQDPKVFYGERIARAERVEIVGTGCARGVSSEQRTIEPREGFEWPIVKADASVARCAMC